LATNLLELAGEAQANTALLKLLLDGFAEVGRLSTTEFVFVLIFHLEVPGGDATEKGGELAGCAVNVVCSVYRR
jgi:hypothetical protein